MDFREVTEFFRDASKYLIILAVMVIIFLFVVAFTPIAGNSMFPTLEEGDVVAISRFSGNFKRNTIVVFKDINGKSYVKRIIGLPGEEVHYLDDVLYINDEGQRENFLGKDIKTNGFMFEDICDEKDCPDGKIPAGKYLVLGDNRPESVDSRDPKIGLVDAKQIEGSVIFRIWPLGKMGGIR